MEASQNSKNKIQFNRGRPHIEIPKAAVPEIDPNQIKNKDIKKSKKETKEVPAKK